MLERIGNCRIVEEVASGGMAVVYRAVQDPLGRTVAIKALKTSAAAEENVVTRFEREAKSLAGLQHENIINVYDFHRERGAMFIVMEYVQGIDLYDLLEKSGRLPYDVAAIMVCYAATLLIDLVCGWSLGLRWWFVAGIAVAAGMAVYHYTLIRGRDRMKCFAAFNHNNWLGAAVFAGVALDYALG